MSTIEKVAAGMFFLIAVYLIFFHADDFNTIVGSIGGGVTDTTRTLQGR